MITKIIREVKTIKPNYECKCEYCGRSFESLRKDAKYCSALCRVNACNERKAKKQSKKGGAAPTPKTPANMKPAKQSGEGITYFNTKKDMLWAFRKRFGIMIKDMKYKEDFEQATGYTYKMHRNYPKYEVYKLP